MIKAFDKTIDLTDTSLVQFVDGKASYADASGLEFTIHPVTGEKGEWDVVEIATGVKVLRLLRPSIAQFFLEFKATVKEVELRYICDNGHILDWYDGRGAVHGVRLDGKNLGLCVASRDDGSDGIKKLHGRFASTSVDALLFKTLAVRT
jgi:hypothetical protein